MKRQWFQIHLSTALLLMFTASIMVWVNTSQWPRVEFDGTSTNFMLCNRYGWPVLSLTVWDESVRELVLDPHKWSLPGAILNMSVAALLLVLTWATSEYLFRRRERGRLQKERQ